MAALRQRPRCRWWMPCTRRMRGGGPESRWPLRRGVPCGDCDVSYMRRRYELAIDLQGAVRSALIGRASGAELVGEAEPREQPARWFFRRRVQTRGVHVIEQAGEVVAEATGLSLAPCLPPLPVDCAAEARVASCCRTQNRWCRCIPARAGARNAGLRSDTAHWPRR